LRAGSRPEVFDWLVGGCAKSKANAVRLGSLSLCFFRGEPSTTFRNRRGTSSARPSMMSRTTSTRTVSAYGVAVSGLESFEAGIKETYQAWRPE
jgi:hypothetical protein